MEYFRVAISAADLRSAPFMADITYIPHEATLTDGVARGVIRRITNGASSNR
jgi:hypothetical protein